MRDYSQEELEERYHKLPPPLKEALFSPDVAFKIFDTGKKHGLSIDQIGDIADEVGFCILGLTRPSEFITNLKDRLHIDLDVARDIASEINHGVFASIRTILKSTHQIEMSDEEMMRQETVIPKKYPPAPPSITPLVPSKIIQPAPEPSKTEGPVSTKVLPLQQESRKTQTPLTKITEKPFSQSPETMTFKEPPKSPPRLQAEPYTAPAPTPAEKSPPSSIIRTPEQRAQELKAILATTAEEKSENTAETKPPLVSLQKEIKVPSWIQEQEERKKQQTAKEEKNTALEPPRTRFTVDLRQKAVEKIEKEKTVVPKAPPVQKLTMPELESVLKDELPASMLQKSTESQVKPPASTSKTEIPRESPITPRSNQQNKTDPYSPKTTSPPLPSRTPTYTSFDPYRESIE